MDGISRPIGAAIDIELDGETIVLEPLRLRDLGTIENHLRAKLPNVIALAAEAAKDLPAAQAEAIMDRAFIEARKIHNIPPEEVMAWIRTIDGFAYSIWLVVDRVYPSRFPLDRIYRFLTDTFKNDRDKFNALKERRDLASGLSDTLGN